jgi:hypothetical protein
MAQRKDETREEYNARRKVAQAVYNAANRDKVRAGNRAWYQRNKGAKRAYERELYRRSPNRRLGLLVRNRLNLALKGLGRPSMEKLLGCTIPQLVAHLESQFIAGMTWANHGQVWHIDHVKQLAAFDLSDPLQLAAACHYTNLAPLPAGENLAKNFRNGNG